MMLPSGAERNTITASFSGTNFSVKFKVKNGETGGESSFFFLQDEILVRKTKIIENDRKLILFGH